MSFTRLNPELGIIVPIINLVGANKRIVASALEKSERNYAPFWLEIASVKFRPTFGTYLQGGQISMEVDKKIQKKDHVSSPLFFFWEKLISDSQ